MTTIFEGQPLQTRPFPNKTSVIWVLGIPGSSKYANKSTFWYVFLREKAQILHTWKIQVYLLPTHHPETVNEGLQGFLTKNRVILLKNGYWVNIYICIYPEPKWGPLFWLEVRPSFGGFFCPTIEVKQVPGIYPSSTRHLHIHPMVSSVIKAAARSLDASGSRPPLWFVGKMLGTLNMVPTIYTGYHGPPKTSIFRGYKL